MCALANASAPPPSIAERMSSTTTSGSPRCAASQSTETSGVAPAARAGTPAARTSVATATIRRPMAERAANRERMHDPVRGTTRPTASGEGGGGDAAGRDALGFEIKYYSTNPQYLLSKKKKHLYDTHSR